MANLTDVIISDASEDSGNPEAARQALTEAVTAPVDTSSSNSATTTETDDGLPAKFKGKSAREIADAYANLESRLGTMANDLGVQRQLTDRLLDMKREKDLSRNGGNTERQKPAPVTTTELLDRPQETLERVVSDRVSSVEESTSARIAQLEAELLKTKFEARHPTYQTTVQDPEFVAWVKASPLRLRAAGVANAGNWQVADELLTEYKSHQNATVSNTTTQNDRTNSHVDEARRASFTSSGNASGTDGKARQGGTIYKRSDLIALRIKDPDAYYDEAFQEKIQAAYAEGRVR